MTPDKLQARQDYLTASDNFLIKKAFRSIQERDIVQDTKDLIESGDKHEKQYNSKSEKKEPAY